SGCAATMNMTRAERSRVWRGPTQISGRFPANVRWRLSTALRCKHGGNDRLVRVHVGDGHAHARRLDDVNGVDADARTDMARRCRDVPWHVGGDDGGDDAAK